MTIRERAVLQHMGVTAISLTIPKESAAAIELSQKKAIAPNGYIMTTNNTSHIFQYPLTLEKEYLWLMETRIDFLKKLTIAERYKLTISYEHLADVWSQNRTEK